jgi:hypothetical protein
MAQTLIYSKKVAAERINLSSRQLNRLIAAGDGPAVVQLSAGRVGIAEADLARWVRARRRVTAPRPAAEDATAA